MLLDRESGIRGSLGAIWRLVPHPRNTRPKDCIGFFRNFDADSRVMADLRKRFHQDHRSRTLRAPPESTPTKAGLGTQGRSSPCESAEGSGGAGGIHSSVDRSGRQSGLSADAFISQHPSGGPRGGEPQWMPADEGRSNDQHLKIDSRRISVIDDVY